MSEKPQHEYLRELVARAGWTQAEAAQHLGVGERTMRRYLAPLAKDGRGGAPKTAVRLLERLVKEHEKSGKKVLTS